MAGSTQLTDLRPITEVGAELVVRFLEEMPEGDRTFFRDDTTLESVLRWTHDERTFHWLLVGPDGALQAYLALIPGVGWGAHVGELRLVVGSDYRRRGIGRALARRGLLEGIRLGLRKLTVEVVADKQGDIEMFSTIGFEPEALLKNQIMDRTGELRDLVVLAHDIDEVRDDLELIGVDDALGLGGTL
jgi:ribosomal protein S18 acetylase RimI-like enzyme